MEGEVDNFIVVWLIVLASLLYSYTVAKFIPQGITRLMAFSMVLCLFFYLPLNLTTMHLGGLTSFFVAWLANFKLILFAFGQGPLSLNPPLPLSRFIPMACLPIKAAQSPENPSQENAKKTKKLPFVKVILFGVLLKVYDYSEYIHPMLKMSLYCFHIYFMLEILLAMVVSMVKSLVQVELEPQFDEPYLATSLQDFWGKRWNLMVSRILHPTVYVPIRFISRVLLPRKWASLVAVFATFLVSGVMHELIFYYIGRLKPTGEVTCFFLLHGALVGLEIAIKNSVNGRFCLTPVVSRPLTLGLVLMTCFQLFFPPFLRFQPYTRGCQESIAFWEFIAHGRLISAGSASCPYQLGEN